MKLLRFDARHFLGLAALIAVTPLSAVGATLVAPAGFDGVDATFISDGPFGSTSGPAGRRYQQIYDASLFASASGPQEITEIQFRAASPENTFRPNSITASNVTVSFSTTSVLTDPGSTAGGNFSASFADNIGADVQVVYSGALTLNRGGSNAAGAQPFSYGFTLQTPFIYDPSMGNLLIDFVVPTTATLTAGAGFGAVESFDASVESNDGTASVTGTGTNTVGAAGQTGLITQFTLAPAVPEPTTALLGLAGVVLAWACRR